MLMDSMALTFRYLLLCLTHTHTHNTADFPVALWLLTKASQTSNEALNKLTLSLSMWNS